MTFLFGNLNLSFCSLYPTNTYTYGVTVTPIVKSIRIQNAKCICCFYLAFVSQKPQTFEIVKVKNCKIFSNTATVTSYFYDGTIDYFIYFLICFILSLSSMLDFSTLSLSSFRLPLSLWIALKSHSFSLCQWLGLHAGVWVMGWWIGGSVGLEFWVLWFFLFWWPVLKGRGGYGWSGSWSMALSSPM